MKQEKGVSAFIKIGYKEIFDKFKTRKYRVLNKDNRDRFIFIGKKGAIRAGKNPSSSISIGKVK